MGFLGWFVFGFQFDPGLQVSKVWQNKRGFLSNFRKDNSDMHFYTKYVVFKYSISCALVGFRLFDLESVIWKIVEAQK